MQEGKADQAAMNELETEKIEKEIVGSLVVKPEENVSGQSPAEEGPAKPQEENSSEQVAGAGSSSDQEPDAEQEAADELLEEKKKRAGEVHFVFDNRVFILKRKRVDIPVIGIRTAIEVCNDEKAQAYLVQRCIGTAIEEIL